MASRFVNMYLGLFGLALFPRRKFIPTKHMRHSGPFSAQWTWMTCLFLSWTWIGDVWSKILNLAIYRQLIQFQTIKMLAKCTRKNGNTPPRVARCGIFSFSPLQPSLFLEKQHAPQSDWREFLPLSCQTCEAFPEALFWNSSWHQSDSPFFSAWYFRKLIYDLENGSWQMYLFLFNLSLVEIFFSLFFFFWWGRGREWVFP